MKTYKDIVVLFLEELKIQVSIKAYNTYKSNNNRFIEYITALHLENDDISIINDEIVNRFFINLSSIHHLDKPTCQKYFFCIRRVWRYAIKHGYTSTFPLTTVVFPKKGLDKSSDVIIPEHSKLLLEDIKEHDPQLYLACLTQYYCFIRPGRELRLLKVGDVDLEKGLITIRQENAKNKTKQIVTMPKQLIDLYFKQNIDKENPDYFIFGSKHKPGDKEISINMLRYRFNKIRERLHLPKEYKFYSFKHTGASNLHISGISMRELMDQLRHTQLEATQHYLKKHCGIINDRIRNNFPSPI